MSDLHAADIDAAVEFSAATFGPGATTTRVLAHITKEIEEVREDPDDLEEWADLLILSLDGATRRGFTGDQVLAAVHAKWAKNRTRNWPDWRTADPDAPIEHVRDDVVTPWWWVSWTGVESFTYHGPWWCSGYDARDRPIFCAAIAARTEDAAQSTVEKAYDEFSDLEWRFVKEQPAERSPFTDRFPRASWMRWPAGIKDVW